MAKIHQVAVMLLLPISIAAAQQNIVLNDGTQYSGKFVSGTANSIVFVDQDGERHRFTTNEIRSITFNGNGSLDNGNSRDDRRRNGQNSAYSRDDNNYDRNRNSPDRNNSSDRYNSSNRGNGNNNGNYAVLPKDTDVAVRTADTINAKEAQPGRMYAASIDRDVVGQNGNVIIPRGSEAQLAVKDAGNGQILLDLNSVTVNGQRYFLSTQSVSQETGNNRGVGANRRTGAYVGGGAALGTLLGAIGGGGKGALIGALAGAAAGAGVQVLTKGSEVRVPSETVLNFRLDQPIYLYQ